ncbi:MAG: DUF3792 family protein [Firmicutes bacterium]|nr:DUF3792 family protein [Bacillota bacterium]
MRVVGITNFGERRSPFNIKMIWYGLLVAFVALSACAVILTLVSLIWDWQETPRALKIANYIIIIIATFYSCRKCSRKLWVNGVTVAILYSVLSTIILGNAHAIISWAWFVNVGILVIFGFIGSFIASVMT